MAITFGNSSSGDTHNNNGDFLLHSISSTSNDVTAVSYNGVAMTQIGSAVYVSANNRYISLWGLVAPAQGSHNFTHTGGADLDDTSLSVSGVSPTNPYTAITNTNGSSTAPSITLTTLMTGSYILGTLFLVNSPYSVNTGTTERGVAGSYHNFYSSTNSVDATSGTISITMTTHQWVFKAFSLNPVISFTQLDTTSTTDIFFSWSVVVILATIQDIVAISDSLLTTFKKWFNQIKNSSIWTNQNKQ